MSNNMPTEIMIRTHDGHQTQLPLELVRFSDFMTNYVKDYPEEVIKIPENAPITNKNHIDIIFQFLKQYKAHNDESVHSTDTKENGHPESAAIANEEQKGIKSESEEVVPQPTLRVLASNVFEHYQDGELFETLNSANFLGVTPFIDLMAHYIAQKITAFTTTEEMSQFLGSDLDDDSMNRWEAWAKENEVIEAQQKKKDEEEEAKRKAEQEAKAKKEREEEELRMLQEDQQDEDTSF